MRVDPAKIQDHRSASSPAGLVPRETIKPATGTDIIPQDPQPPPLPPRPPPPLPRLPDARKVGLRRRTDSCATSYPVFRSRSRSNPDARTRKRATPTPRRLLSVGCTVDLPASPYSLAIATDGRSINLSVGKLSSRVSFTVSPRPVSSSLPRF